MFILSILGSIFYSLLVVVISSCTLLGFDFGMKALQSAIKLGHIPIHPTVAHMFSSFAPITPLNLNQVLLFSILIGVIALKCELSGGCLTGSSGATTQSGSARKTK